MIPFSINIPPFYVQSLAFHFLSSCTLFMSPHTYVWNGRNRLRFYDLIDIKSGKYLEKQRNYQFYQEKGRGRKANDNNVAKRSDV